MARERLVAFSEDGWREYQSFIRNQQRQANVQRRDFRKKYPILQGGGGDCDCPSHVYLVEYKVAATSGTCDLIVNLNGTDLTTISMPWNQIGTGLSTQISALGLFSSDPTNYKVVVGGGGISSGTGLPGNSLTVWFDIPEGETVSIRRSTQSLSPAAAFLTVSQISKPS